MTDSIVQKPFAFCIRAIYKETELKTSETVTPQDKQSVGHKKKIDKICKIREDVNETLCTNFAFLKFPYITYSIRILFFYARRQTVFVSSLLFFLSWSGV